MEIKKALKAVFITLVIFSVFISGVVLKKEHDKKTTLVAEKQKSKLIHEEFRIKYLDGKDLFIRRITELIKDKKDLNSAKHQVDSYLNILPKDKDVLTLKENILIAQLRNKYLPSSLKLDNLNNLLILRPKNKEYLKYRDKYAAIYENELIAKRKSDRILKAENIKKSKRKKEIEKQFYYNGEHESLGLYVRKRLHDRKSFEHIKTTYIDKGDHLVLQMNYRAKNMLGALILQSVIAKVSLGGKVLDIYTE